MSVIKFELKEEHIKLLKHLRWSLMENNFLVSAENIREDIAPFGSDNVYEAVDLILNGKPENFNPIETEVISYTKEQCEEWDKILSELPLALEIILHLNTFELCWYKAKYHDRLWKKI
jgi:hypothetical protein